MNGGQGFSLLITKQTTHIIYTMEITGRIIFALPEQSGVSKAGNNWKKREYVLETQESFPKKIMFDFFGERAEQFPLQIGQLIRLTFDIESRDYNGRWYTSIRGLRADVLEEVAAAPAAAPAVYPAAQPTYPTQPTGTVPPPPAVNLGSADEDLPF